MIGLTALAAGAAIGLVYGIGERSFGFGLKIFAVSSGIAFCLIAAGL